MIRQIDCGQIRARCLNQLDGEGQGDVEHNTARIVLHGHRVQPKDKGEHGCGGQEGYVDQEEMAVAQVEYVLLYHLHLA